MSGDKAAQITKASKSNLALSFFVLPANRRKDITTFYAFCRIIDDIADSETLSVTEKSAQLTQWRNSLQRQLPDEPNLAPVLREVISKYQIPLDYFSEILAGVEMDLSITRYADFEDLRVYCHRVASVVGLVSIEIFGCQNEESKPYAVDLGIALQLTNILRDVGADWTNGGRIYLPQNDMEQFGYSVENLAAGVHSEKFVALMNFEAQRARDFYAKAVAHLPTDDRRALKPAEIMRAVYERLLTRMERDRFRVFHQRYALSRTQKLVAIVDVLMGGTGKSRMHPPRDM